MIRRFDEPVVFDQTISVIDSHTCGQPTRVVVEGSGIAPGTDPIAAREILAQSRDWVRRLAVFEPRGHRSMFGVALIEPANAGEPFGVVYMDANGYPDMCGHATIGAVTTLFEAGYLTPEPADLTGAQTLTLHAPMGVLELTARFEAGRCVAVAFRTPLAYYLGSQELRLADGSLCTAEIANGGQWYAYVPVENAGLSIAPENIDALVGAAVPVREALAAQLSLVDPVTGVVPQVGNIVWTSAPDTEDAQARNVPISSAGSFDRSPCGTATCARMATLAAKGELAVGEAFVNQGLVGTLYQGELVDAARETAVAGFIPQVEGSAWMTGRATFWRDPHDPLGEGFLV
ncbi:proline racemase family protein [Novosphingobium resinovorum]|uniref:proline racemase family protein n=2 Tax=Novosphingobium TaxID=165696 RepID=UPI0025A1B309|nr:proline racemase family protein [Novosphingobium resinovorum]WJM25810.1 proline racemase family protein [Novosphingobium resinovorum]